MEPGRDGRCDRRSFSTCKKACGCCRPRTFVPLQQISCSCCPPADNRRLLRQLRILASCFTHDTVVLGMGSESGAQREVGWRRSILCTPTRGNSVKSPRGWCNWRANNCCSDAQRNAYSDGSATALSVGGGSVAQSNKGINGSSMMATRREGSAHSRGGSSLPLVGGSTRAASKPFFVWAIRQSGLRGRGCTWRRR